MKRTLLLLVLALTLLAVPASAASWRNYASVRANGGNYASGYTSARTVQDIQLGIYTYGSSATVDWDGSWSCYTSNYGSYGSRSKSGHITTSPRTWKWIDLRSSSTTRWECTFDGSAVPRNRASVKIKLRVK